MTQQISELHMMEDNVNLNSKTSIVRRDPKITLENFQCFLEKGLFKSIDSETGNEVCTVFKFWMI